MGLLLLIIVIILLAGALPTWPYSRQWGYAPSGTLGTILLILLILVMLDYVPLRILSGKKTPQYAVAWSEWPMASPGTAKRGRIECSLDLRPCRFQPRPS